MDRRQAIFVEQMSRKLKSQLEKGIFSNTASDIKLRKVTDPANPDRLYDIKWIENLKKEKQKKEQESQKRRI